MNKRRNHFLESRSRRSSGVEQKQVCLSRFFDARTPCARTAYPVISMPRDVFRAQAAAPHELSDICVHAGDAFVVFVPPHGFVLTRIDFPRGERRS